jgi:nitroreductase
VYALRDQEGWAALVEALNPFNRGWASKAAALVFIASKTTLRRAGEAEDSPSHSHSFDAGAAWGFLALQANTDGWATHGMTGLDFTAAAKAIGLPEGYRLEAAIAIGRPGDKGDLPEFLRERETPSGREPLEALVREARFPD